MPWESIQLIQIMFIEENNLKRKIWKVYVEDRLAQSDFNDLHQKKKWKGSPF
jgi:hypothetical protein